MRKTSDLLDLLSEKFLKFSYQNAAKTTTDFNDGAKTKYDQRGCYTETFEAKSRLANSFNLSKQGMKPLARYINKTPQLKYKSRNLFMFKSEIHALRSFCAFSFQDRSYSFKFWNDPESLKTLERYQRKVIKDRSCSLKWRFFNILSLLFFKNYIDTVRKYSRKSSTFSKTSSK
jgi:hypothetical protein